MNDHSTTRRIVGSGDYMYEYIPGWGDFPPDLYNNSIAVDSHDRVFVCALGFGKGYPLLSAPLIVIADPDGTVVESWGTGVAVHAHGLNIVDDTVFVADKPAHVCLKFTLDGKILQVLGQHGIPSDTGCLKSGDPVPRAAGPFNHPEDFISSPWGDLYAADGTHNTRVHRFDSGGHLIQSWGHWGDEPGNFKSPHSVLPTPDGRLIVCDRLNHRIQIFDRKGKLLDIWTGFQWPCKVLPTEKGDYLVCEDPGNQTKPGVTGHGSERDAARESGIRVIDRNGKFMTHLAVGRTHWMAMDSYGDIYTATHTAVNKLVRLWPDGKRRLAPAGKRPSMRIEPAGPISYIPDAAIV
jgi:hypothetical protein